MGRAGSVRGPTAVATALLMPHVPPLLLFLLPAGTAQRWARRWEAGGAPSLWWPPWFYGSPGRVAGAVCLGSAPATPQPHSLAPSLLPSATSPWPDPVPCVRSSSYPYPGYFRCPGFVGAWAGTRVGLGHRHQQQGPAEGATIAAGAGTPLQLRKSSTFNFAVKFPTAAVGFEKRVCVWRQRWASMVRPWQSFHPSSALNVGWLQGTNCARSPYPLHHILTPEHSLEEPMSWTLQLGWGRWPRLPTTSPCGPQWTSPARRSAATPRLQDWSLCQYWTPLKWFLGTSNYGHLNMNILQSRMFTSLGQHIVVLHCKINDPCTSLNFVWI